MSQFFDRILISTVKLVEFIYNCQVRWSTRFHSNISCLICVLEEENNGKRERGPKYTEGWVEFQSKREAKLITKQLNNQQVGGRRRTPWYEDIWNIK